MFFKKDKSSRSKSTTSNQDQDDEHRRLNNSDSIGSSSSLRRLAANSNGHSSGDRLLSPESQSLTLIDEPARFELYDPESNIKKRDLMAEKSFDGSRRSLTPRLAKAETIEEDQTFDELPYNHEKQQQHYRQQQQPTSCTAKVCRLVARRATILILIIILSCMAAIYCIPYVDINPRIPKPLPGIPFNFRDGPLKASDVNQFKAEQLFKNQIHGPESIALDSYGNMYLAIEGGFILYTHLNASSPFNRAFMDNRTSGSLEINPTLDNQFAREQFASDLVALTVSQSKSPQLIKLAELNPIKQVSFDQRRREGISGSSDLAWRRECQLDEQLYGKNLWSNKIDDSESSNQMRQSKFSSKVVMSRCSKPLGIRLSPDENYLYVIDTLSGLYRVHLRQAERPNSPQRVVTKLLDFRKNMNQLLPVTFFDLAAGQTFSSNQVKRQALDMDPPAFRVPTYLNVSLKAVDDLVIDYGAGTRGGDIIYMSIGSQNWPALSFIYDLVEGRPSGAILRYDTSVNQLSVLSPNQIAHVRTSSFHANPREHESWVSWPDFSSLFSDSDIQSLSPAPNSIQPETEELTSFRYGTPRLDENDIFDDRELFFPNGLELTDDKQALLIADTANKRIIKHFIRGPRKGTSDLWAWTPNFPDNIRRGYDKKHETYWVAGCGHDTTGKIDILSWLNPWPRLRKFMLKNIYLFGWFVEVIGSDIFKSNRMRDYGYSIRLGHSLCQGMCPGMMILQYNSHGDLIRSIHSQEFPNDLAYYSQANEVVDSRNRQHYLYLSSPSYDYVTKLMLPNDSPPSLSQVDY